MMKRQKKEGTQMIESLREYVNYIERDWGVEKREKTINIFQEGKREREEKRCSNLSCVVFNRPFFG